VSLLYDLYKGVFISSSFIEQEFRIIGEKELGKDLEKNHRDLIWGAAPEFAGESQRYMESLQYYRFPDRVQTNGTRRPV
jgi:hypothetical protein